MYNTNAQGKGHKVAATQETITAQNSANQGTKKTFDGTKELFNAVSEEQLRKALTYYDFGIVKPAYIISNLKMAQRLIDKARMSDDQKAVLCNSYGFLLVALCTGKEYEKWEHIAQRYYPDDLDDITVGEDGEFADKEELTQAVCYEIECILADWDTSVSAYDPEDWPEAEELINEYIDVLDDHDCEVPEWVFQGRDERYEWYNA